MSLVSYVGQWSSRSARSAGRRVYSLPAYFDMPACAPCGCAGAPARVQHTLSSYPAARPTLHATCRLSRMLGSGLLVLPVLLGDECTPYLLHSLCDYILAIRPLENIVHCPVHLSCSAATDTSPNQSFHEPLAQDCMARFGAHLPVFFCFRKFLLHRLTYLQHECKHDSSVQFDGTHLHLKDLPQALQNAAGELLHSVEYLYSWGPSDRTWTAFGTSINVPPSRKCIVLRLIDLKGAFRQFLKPLKYNMLNCVPLSEEKDLRSMLENWMRWRLEIIVAERAGLLLRHESVSLFDHMDEDEERRVLENECALRVVAEDAFNVNPASAPSFPPAPAAHVARSDGSSVSLSQPDLTLSLSPPLIPSLLEPSHLHPDEFVLPSVPGPDTTTTPAQPIEPASCASFPASPAHEVHSSSSDPILLPPLESTVPVVAPSRRGPRQRSSSRAPPKSGLRKSNRFMPDGWRVTHFADGAEPVF